MSTWQVSEIFYSIQGEGATTGRATAFIRLGGCTLGCQWCDTKYTWRGGPMRDKTQILATVTTIEIETAGFAPLAQVQCAPLAHQLNVSPKLANSGVPAERRIQLPVLQFLRDTGKAYFKFVIDAPGDLAEVDTLVAILAPSGGMR